MAPSQDHPPDPSPVTPPPPSLADKKAQYNKARNTSLTWQSYFEALSLVSDQALDPGEEQSDPDDTALNHERANVAIHLARTKKLELDPELERKEIISLPHELAYAGVELAKSQKAEFRLEKELILLERDAALLAPVEATNRLLDVNRRYLAAGASLWHHQQTKSRHENPATFPQIDPRPGSATACLMALYQPPSAPPATPPRSFLADALKHYAGSRRNRHDPGAWCHVTGCWWFPESIEAVPVVPLPSSSTSVCEILFGPLAPALHHASNALLLSPRVRNWFDALHVVIVPVDAEATRWRMDVIAPCILRDSIRRGLPSDPCGEDLDGRELEFRNEKRPGAGFLFFRFVVALVVVRSEARSGWEGVWARYAEQPPFPRPSGYMRRSMVVALATHFGPTELGVVEAWMAGYGFETTTGLRLDEEQATEAARRVLCAVEEAAGRAERGLQHVFGGEEDEDTEEEEEVEEEEEGEESGEDEWEREWENECWMNIGRSYGTSI